MKRTALWWVVNLPICCCAGDGCLRIQLLQHFVMLLPQIFLMEMLMRCTGLSKWFAAILIFADHIHFISCRRTIDRFHNFAGLNMNYASAAIVVATFGETQLYDWGCFGRLAPAVIEVFVVGIVVIVDLVWVVVQFGGCFCAKNANALIGIRVGRWSIVLGYAGILQKIARWTDGPGLHMPLTSIDGCIGIGNVGVFIVWWS